jgi:ABC-type Fe3+ transport system permease subunit
LTKRRKWLSRAAVITGAILVLLLILAINSEPLVRWFQIGPQEAGQERGLEQADAGSVVWHKALGTTLISVFILAILASHLALLIVVANSLNKAQLPATGGPAVCPRCERGIQPDWRMCPFCGFELDKALDRSSTK